MNLEVSEQTLGHIDNVRKHTGAESMSEAIRRSITVYEKLLDMEELGERVVIKRPSEADQVLLIA